MFPLRRSERAVQAGSRGSVSITAGSFPLALWLAVLFLWLSFSAAAVAHVKGCHSRKCDRRIHWKRARHWCHAHIWECRWHHVQPVLRFRLARLRWCESTNNYRAVNGQYTGAYQYSASTWARAGGYGIAMYAPPREQDVRTAWFFPSHTSEWECQA